MSSARQIVKQAAASGFYYSGAFGRIMKRRTEQNQACVLGLHRVLRDEDLQYSYSEPAIVLKETTFTELCKFLAEHFDVVPLDFVLSGQAKTSNGRPRCVVTFDDGWQDNYSRALPVLRSFGFPATIFLATSMMDSQSTFWIERVRAYAADPERWRRLRAGMSDAIGKKAEDLEVRDVTEHLKRMSSGQRDKVIAEFIGELPQAGASDRMLTWEQVAGMSRAGVEFASHTHTHPLLPYEPADLAAMELRISREALQQHGLHARCAFAYPNGSWDHSVRPLVQKAGYTCAATTKPGWFAPEDDPYTMPRVLLHEGNVTGPDGRFSPAAAALTLMGWR